MEENCYPDGTRILHDDVSERRIYPPGRLRMVVAVARSDEDIHEINGLDVPALSEALALALQTNLAEADLVVPGGEATYPGWSFETSEPTERVARRVCAALFPLLLGIDDSDPEGWRVMIDVCELREYQCLTLGGPLDMINKAIPE